MPETTTEPRCTWSGDAGELRKEAAGSVVICGQAKEAMNHQHSMLCPRDHAEELICHVFVEPAAATLPTERLVNVEWLKAAFLAADGATRWGGPWTIGDIQAVLDTFLPARPIPATERTVSMCAEHQRWEYIPSDLNHATDPHEPGPAPSDASAGSVILTPTKATSHLSAAGTFRTTFDPANDCVTAEGQGHRIAVYRDPEETPGGFLIFCHVEGKGAVATVEIAADQLPQPIPPGEALARKALLHGMTPFEVQKLRHLLAGDQACRDQDTSGSACDRYLTAIAEAADHG